jgi:hypothetical protein
VAEAWPACLLACFFERPRHEESEGTSAGKQKESKSLSWFNARTSISSQIIKLKAQVMFF